jgi:septal ring-binding cell division protein DamX
MHTIQIMGTNSEDQLKSHLRALAKVLEPQKIYVFRTVAQGKPVMTVVYGGYADRQSAMQALEKLPPSVSANRPVLRTVSGIRSELKQHGIRTES